MLLERLYEDVKERVLSRIEEEGITSEEEICELFYTEIVASNISQEFALSDWKAVEKKLYADIIGYGIIDELVREPEISEIMINAKDAIYYERDCNIYKFDGAFKDNDEVMNMVERIVSRHNRQVNFREPIVDTRLPDGARVSVVLPPISTNGCPVVTIRKFRPVDIDMQMLIRSESISEEIADLLFDAVKQRKTILISGGTGTGKTTFLNALSSAIGEDERVITVEDCQELRLQKIKNLIQLECRNGTTEGAKEISMRDLVKTTLRMRPDRIIIGEVRGAEALDLLQAMNTGHDGSLTTLHANSCKDAIARLEILTLMAMELPVTAIRAQIASAIQIIVHMKKDGIKGRVVDEVSVIEGVKNGQIQLKSIYKR